MAEQLDLRESRGGQEQGKGERESASNHGSNPRESDSKMVIGGGGEGNGSMVSLVGGVRLVRYEPRATSRALRAARYEPRATSRALRAARYEPRATSRALRAAR